MLASILVTGCASRLVPIQQAYRSGDLDTAAEKIEGYAKSHAKGTPQTVLAWIEAGSMLRTVGRYEDSDEAFAQAEARIAALDEKPPSTAAQEFSAALRTPDRLTYRGFFYDRQFVALYRALNSMALGDLEAPRQHFILADRWQTRAIEHNQERIARANEEKAAAREKAPTLDKTMEDERFLRVSQERYGNLSAYESYGEFANPYVDMVRAVYSMGVASSASDYDIARNLMRRVAGMVPQNPTIMADLDLADRLAQSQAELPDLTYVFFETGVAPCRAQTQIPVPVFLVTNEVQIVPIAVPYLEFSDNYVRTLSISGPRTSAETALLADVDRIVAAEFKAQLPTMITRMIAAAAVKAGVQYGANQAAKQTGDEIVQLATMIVGAIWATTTNEADVRTWATLPKQVQYARLGTPDSGEVTLRIGPQAYNVSVDPEGINLIIVRSVTPTAPPMITSCRLAPQSAMMASAGAEES